MAWTNLDDSYVLSGGMVSSAVTSLAQVPASNVQASIESTIGSFYAKFVSGGTTVDFYQQQNTPLKIGSGSYAIVTVSGQQILEITIPAALRSQYKMTGNPIYGIVNGVVSSGKHNVPGVDYSNSMPAFNSVVSQYLQNNFNP